MLEPLVSAIDHSIVPAVMVAACVASMRIAAISPGLIASVMHTPVGATGERYSVAAWAGDPPAKSAAHATATLASAIEQRRT